MRRSRNFLPYMSCMDWVDILRRLIKSERIRNWDMHAQAMKRMLCWLAGRQQAQSVHKICWLGTHAKFKDYTGLDNFRSSCQLTSRQACDPNTAVWYNSSEIVMTKLRSLNTDQTLDVIWHTVLSWHWYCSTWVGILPMQQSKENILEKWLIIRFRILCSQSRFYLH